ncbi:unnamed protein product [Rotaria sordida]|uniref:Uncharacterized protein n=1 Tax=Rotaria sordida TaxID=392033 RepID=A0A814UNQ5_9BILA|nr:unnamed protein product [Rotaria sordida]CAF1400618.1 unnamed protein product [Rotaria sordida]
MSSAQKTRISYLKRKENVKESDNNSNNIVNDNTTNMHGICHDYWKPTIPSYSEMNTRTRAVFTIRPFVYGKYAPDQSESLEKHQESTYHKIAVQSLSFRQQERSVAQLANCNDIQTLLKHLQLTLIQPSDTRWLSYSHSINAVIHCYERLSIDKIISNITARFESNVFNIIKQ